MPLLPVPFHTRTASNYSFWSAGQHHRGYCQFIKATDMEEATKGGSFRIRCDVTVMKETCVETTMANYVTVPASELNQHLGTLLDSKVRGDVTFDVGGEQFTAHQYVLAAWSSVLMAELFGPTNEGEHHVQHTDR